jgi:Domain of unknown function (DUF397)
MHDSPTYYHGMPASELQGVQWCKSRRSTAEGECVQTAKLPGGGVAVRNSRHPEGPVLLFSDTELRTFLEAVKQGYFDDVLGRRD